MRNEDIELLSNSKVPESIRNTIAEQMVRTVEANEDRKLEREKLESERRRFFWSTPFVAALAGLITLAATFLFQELGKTSSGDLAASAEERQFQFEIVRDLLLAEELTEVDRARSLLFLARAGVLNALDEAELRTMAELTITNAGQDPSDVGVPSLPSLSTSRLIERIIVGVEPNVALSTLRRRAIEDLGWSDLGMHYRVDLDGTVEVGRSIGSAPAFALGSNEGAVAVALSCSDWTELAVEPKDPCVFTEEQIASSVQLIESLMKEHDVDIGSVFSRGELRPQVHSPQTVEIIELITE